MIKLKDLIKETKVSASSLESEFTGKDGSFEYNYKVYQTLIETYPSIDTVLKSIILKKDLLINSIQDIQYDSKHNYVMMWLRPNVGVQITSMMCDMIQEYDVSIKFQYYLVISIDVK